MKRAMTVLLAATIIAALNSFAGAQTVDPGIPVVNTDKMSLNVFGRGQMIGVGENVPDPIRDHNRIYLFMKEARLGVKGNYDDAFKFEAQLAFGGEDANGSNTDLSLLDLVADVPVKALGENTIVKIGQFRVPFGREGLTDRGYMDYGDRSIASMASYQGRDYGLAIMGTKGKWTGTIGTFSGGGRDVPQRYLPERLGIPEVVARFGYNDGVDEDIYHVVAQDLNLRRTTKAAYVSALYTHDTLIGHSTPLLVHTIDKNLLIDTNYNPYINNGGPNGGTGAYAGNSVGSANALQAGDMFMFGTDAAIRHPLGNGQQVGAEIEGSWGGYQNRFGVIHIASARVQGDYQIGQFGIAARYSLLSMDDKAGYLTAAQSPAKGATYTNSGMGQPIHEIDPSLTWHFKGHNMKIVADLPVYLDCPVFLDPALGMYAFPDPTSTDENTVAGANSMRRTITEARMMFQFMF